MKILIDGDACPVKDIAVKVAKENNLRVVIVLDTSHVYSDGYSQVITVDKGKDSVDFALINLTKPDDVVITQDYGLAAMALGKKAKAINQNGLIFSDRNIDELLTSRHISNQIRRCGGHTKGPKKRTKDNNVQFERQFRYLIGG